MIRTGLARIGPLALAVALTLLLLGCSPESQRTRGGGMGADVGNRVLGPALNAHGPVDPLYAQPQVGRAIAAERAAGTATPAK